MIDEKKFYEETNYMIDSRDIYGYIKIMINPYGRPFEGTIFEFGNKLMDYIIRMEKQPKAGEWIPFKEREADEDEQNEYGFTHMMDCKLPDEDEEILVTYSNGYVGLDTFLKEGFECYLDSNMEFCTEAIAWMPKPESYKGE